jgi:hypothetical protein
MGLQLQQGVRLTAPSAAPCLLLRGGCRPAGGFHSPQWNPVDESEFQRPNAQRISAFKAVLESKGMTVSVRSTRGLEAAAACGQLRNQFQKQPLPVPEQRALT